VFRKEIIIVVEGKDGRVETRRITVDKVGDGGRGGDLVTLWALRLICCLFANVPNWGSASISFVDLFRVSRTVACISYYSPSFLSSYCANRAPFIGFGSSSATPSRSDYRLVSELARVQASCVVDESAFECRIVGSWTPTASVSICEVGLYMRVCDYGNVARFVLFDRSVLSPCISVPGGSTVTATYVFRF
jgi:hypothetical protein